jgi:hypothetical protein
MIRRILGVDPGLASAAACVYGYDGGKNYPEILGVLDVPTINDDTEKEIDGQAFRRFILQHDPDICYMERATTMPSIPDPRTGMRRQMGTATMGRYFAGVGALRATVRLCDLEIVHVMPGQWKKALGLVGEKKRGSLELVRNLHPESADRWFKRQKDHNRGEAALIAIWGAARCDLIQLRPAA